MFYFNLLLILLVDFHVYFGLLFSKRAHLKGLSKKRAHRQKAFGEGVGGGRHPPPRPPPPPPPAPEGLRLLFLFFNHRFIRISFSLFEFFCFCFMSNKSCLMLLNSRRYPFSLNTIFFINEKHTQWNLETKVKVFHESISCFIKCVWSCIPWNALKEKLLGIYAQLSLQVAYC